MTIRPITLAALAALVGVLIASKLLSAAPSSGRIVLGTPILQTINETGICVEESVINYAEQWARITYQSCDNANPPNYTGLRMMLHVTAGGYRITRPYAADITGVSVSFTNAVADLAALPAAAKVLMRRAVAGT